MRPFLSARCEFLVFRQGHAPEERVLRAVEQVYRTARSESFARELKICNAASALWEALVEFTRGDLPADRADGGQLMRSRLQKMMEYIHVHYQEPLSLAGIAHAANISRSEALRCFHRGIQTTPVTYWNDYRLSRARERLLTTCDTVTAVSEAAGFENASCFCRAFKKRYGCSPNALRRGGG